MNTLRYILALLLAIINITASIAQCNEIQVEEAASKAGSNAIFLREFKAHLPEGTIKNPAPIKKINIILNKNVQYRFTVADSKSYNGRMLLQLFNKGELLGSTFDVYSKLEKPYFDFRCQKTGNYQILLSFREGIEGCGAGVMSMVVGDSTQSLDPSVKKVDTNSNKLYVGIDNELGIASSQIQDGHLEVRISQGIISGQNGVYIARPDHIGKAVVSVSVFDNKNNLKETDSTEFTVELPLLPDALFSNKSGGFISKNDLKTAKKISLNNDSPFEIIGFSIQKSRFDVQSLTSGNAYLTNRQIQFLQALQSGETFIITHILVKGSDNKVFELNPLGFIVD